MDNSIKRTMAWKPLDPYGFYVTYVEDGENIPDDVTLIEPPDISRPKFDFNTQKWTLAPETPIEPSAMQEIVIQQAQTIAQIQSVMIQQSKDIATLKGVNK
ncbi:hypothetical protein EFN43_09080 [Pediococcus pentosaceus]|uniref:hypothetical protein n=1 Tax=Pediococcus pentosaceus TaxID=1255 RepID=UPI00133007FE|nr:hypothetical protein [Pediococcus pentosaceus]KAF0422845.1 hypothetical protein GBO84_05875 [Pediococcus pentosaceus]MBF7131085.1 hypothetical protein [Pediococcus pentosaceus]MCT3021210.1 hypothetical protein [Pediococcus pentosaceus]